MSRLPISKKVRFEIFKRDGFTCQYCGAHPPDVILHVDHIKPVSRGGGNEPENLITACEACNLGKGATPLTAVPGSLDERTARIMEAEEQLAAYERVMAERRKRIEEDAWEVIDILFDRPKDIPLHRLRSVKSFVERIGLSETMEAAEIAASRRITRKDDRFRYFCGICWKKAREIGQ